MRPVDKRRQQRLKRKNKGKAEQGNTDHINDKTEDILNETEESLRDDVQEAASNDTSDDMQEAE